ncbi:MAG: shikimate dehydrogenase [Ferruginibacter sp.]
MKLYGLIGYPLTHSFSKKYFEAKFVAEKIPSAIFELFPLENISEFTGLTEQHPDLRGLAVTIPYKESVIPFLTHTDDAAGEIGAVNCIKFSGSQTTGFNTDVTGFERSFLPLLQPHHTKALILGTGGASKAVQYILKKHGIEFILISRINSGKNNVITYEEINEDIIREHTIIINCTPVGMTPDEECQPALPYHLLTPDHLLYDLVYKPAETKFMQQGKKRGCTVKNGFEMLVIQAEENWRIWNGR